MPHPKQGLSTPRPGPWLRHAVPPRPGPPDTRRPGFSGRADPVAPGDDATEGDYVHSLTFTERFSGGTENRAVGNKRAEAGRAPWREREPVGPDTRADVPTDHGGEFLNWARPRHRTGRAVQRPWTRRRADRPNDHAHGEPQHWTPGRPRLGHDRFGHPERVPLRNDL